MFDLVGGRAAWIVEGLPTEGQIGDRRRIRDHVAPAPSVPIDATAGDIVTLGELRFPVAVVDAEHVLLGAVAPVAATVPADTPVERLMISAPGTIRPDLRVEEVAKRLSDDQLDHVFVTTTSGRLLGIVVTEDLHV